MKFWAKQNLSVKPPEGGKRVELEEVNATFVPPPTAKHTPVPHGPLVEAVVSAVFERGFAINETFHMLSHGGLRYYGLLDVKSKSYSPDHSWIVAILNSNDRQATANIVAGCRIHPSNAIAFSGEVNVTRKHTKELLLELPRLADATIEEVWGKWNLHDQRMEGLKQKTLVDEKVSHVIILALERGIIRLSDVPKVLKAFRKPKMEVFKNHSAWSLYNAFLVTMQDQELGKLMKSTIAITKLFDEVCDFRPLLEKWVQPELV